MRLLNLVILAGGCLLVQACAMQPLSPDKASQYKKIGILSAIGDNFYETEVGVMVFSNQRKSDQLKIGVDEIFTDDAIKALSAKYVVVDLAKYRDKFVGEPMNWSSTNAIFGTGSTPTAGEVVRRDMGPEGLDAYVLVTPGAATVTGTNQHVGGIGIVKLQGLLNPNKCKLHAAFMVSVIDGRDYALAADMRASPLPGGGLLGLGGSALNAPNLDVDCATWDAPTASAESIKQSLRSLLERSVPQTLRDARLLP